MLFYMTKKMKLTNSETHPERCVIIGWMWSLRAWCSLLSNFSCGCCKGEPDVINQDWSLPHFGGFNTCTTKSAMGVCPAVSRYFRRWKYMILLLLSVSVLAWIATFAGETVKAIQDTHRSAQTLEDNAEVLRGGMQYSWKTVMQVFSNPLPDTPPPKESCPEKSPLLRK